MFSWKHQVCSAFTVWLIHSCHITGGRGRSFQEVDEVPVWFFPCFACLGSLVCWWKFSTEFFFSPWVASQWALVDRDKALCGLVALYLFSVPFVILTISVIWTKNSITITELGRCRNLQEQIYVRWFLFPKILLSFDVSGWRIKVVACCTWFLIPFASFNLRWC